MTLITTNVSIIDTTNNSEDIYLITYLTKIRQYGVIFLVAFGLIFNSLSFVVFAMSKLRKTSQGLYLMTLSVSDNLVLITEIFIWIKFIDVVWLDHNDVLCRLTYTLRYAGRLWSALLVTTITIERYFFIVHPLQSKKTKKFQSALRTKIMCGLTCILSHLLSTYAIFTLKSQPKLNAPKGEFVCGISIDLQIAFTVCDLIVSRGIADVVTGLLIVVFTSLIVKHLIRSRQLRQRELQVHNSSLSQRQSQLTVMLLVLAVSFILLKLPYTAAWYSRYLLKMSHQNNAHYKVPVLMDAAISLTYVFTIMTYSLNFVFYIICGSSFRTGFLRLIQCKRELLRPAVNRDVYITVNGQSSSIQVETAL